jgi:transposase-like protein
MSAPIRSPFQRPRWTAQDARTALAALERSGKSVREFAKQHGLDPQRFWSWRRRVAGGDHTTFRELIVRQSAPMARQEERSPFEIRLPSGVVICVPPTFDSAALGRLLEVVAQARTC